MWMVMKDLCINVKVQIPYVGFLSRKHGRAEGHRALLKSRPSYVQSICQRAIECST